MPKGPKKARSAPQWSKAPVRQN